LAPWPLLIVAVTAFAVVAPFFFLGIPSGHDFEFHVNSWMEVLQQWHQGIVYPRWAALAHYGYGEARFIFYPPVSWTLGAALGAILPWKAVPGIYVWLVLTLSGGSMFLLARRWLDGRSAIFAAALYTANPYYMVIVYWRSAFAELLAGALLPLLLLLVLHMEEKERKGIIPLGLVVAAAWLTNAPSAVMVNYSLALLVVIIAIVRHSRRVLLCGAAAIVLGAALAAFYIFPAAHEAKWVNIEQVLSPGVRPQDNFLFTTINDPDHNRFNLLVSIVAGAEMVVLSGAIFLVFKSRFRLGNGNHRLKNSAAAADGNTSVFGLALIAWAGAAMLLMFPFTLVAWEYLPKLRFVQLPWRWMLCLNVPFTLLLAAAWRRWRSRALACLLMMAALVFVWHRVQVPWWDNAADIAEMRDNIEQGQGYEGTDEYVPIAADPYEIKQDARRVTLEGDGQARIHVREWGPESKLFNASLSQPGKLVLRLFNYPAWKVGVNGQVIATETHEVTGQMVIPVVAGDNQVRVKFTRTWDRTAGGVVSAGALLLTIGLLMFHRRQQH
jgi:hypothetical protein